MDYVQHVGHPLGHPERTAKDDEVETMDATRIASGWLGR